jgi:regulator of sigma E protease
MDILIKILQFTASLSLLVIIHELGHFLFAKMFGVRVEKFYVFFNPKFSLVKFHHKGTEYGIGWIPFGGYTKLAGMIDESLDTEQMKQPPQPYEFRSKPAWQRLLIMVGGVLMNVVLAIIIYIGISYTWGDQYVANEDVRYGSVFSETGTMAGFQTGDKILAVNNRPQDNYYDIFPNIVMDNTRNVEILRGDKAMTVDVPESLVPLILNDRYFMSPRLPFVVGKVAEGMGAEKAGIMAGDSLIALNGNHIEFYDQYIDAFAEHKGLTVELTVARDSAGVERELQLPVAISEQGTIGVYAMPAGHFITPRTKTYTFWQSIPEGFKRTGQEISDYWKQIKLLFQPKTEAYKSLGGFITMGSIFPDRWIWEVFWRITAFFSLALAVLNILPIPALDGGHVMFLLYEVITRRKPSDRFMVAAQVVGILLLFSLIIFANGNDIYRLFSR